MTSDTLMPATPPTLPERTQPPPTPVDKSGARVKRLFGAIARRYDLLNHLLSLGVDKYWRWRTVRRVPPAAGRPVLDICTGTGDLALAYFKKSGGRVPIVAADFCHEMLVLGSQKGRRVGGAETIRWIEADSQRLPLADDRYQIVSVAFGLRNVSDTMRGLREMVRVCAPGGRVVVLEFSMPTWQPMKAIYGWYFNHVLPRIGQLLARNREAAYNYLPQSVGQFPQGEELLKRMREAGLSDVQSKPLSFGIASLYCGTKETR